MSKSEKEIPRVAVGVFPLCIAKRKLFARLAVLFFLLFPFGFMAWVMISGGLLNGMFLTLLIVAGVGAGVTMIATKMSERRIAREVEDLDCLVCPVCASVLTDHPADVSCPQCMVTYGADDVKGVWQRWFKKDILLTGATRRRKSGDK